MLGRLIQTAASYGRGSTTLESATEESHTRNLLYGQSYATYTLAQSPPSSPYATPVFRPGSFDDRGGLELEEKDVRILIAQDAGAEDKPTLLFDSQPPSTAVTQPTTHVRHVSMTGSRTAAPNDWKSQPHHAATMPLENPLRNRGASLAGVASPWSRSARDAGTREEAFLECMFGVTSSTKVASTTKMHILPGKPKNITQSDNGSKIGVDMGGQQPRRAPLNRARTSNTIVRTQHPHNASVQEAESLSQDSVLITRVFNIVLSEAVAPTSRSTEAPTSPESEIPIEPSSMSPRSPQGQFLKKPKLVERKVPAFAVGLIINLPRHAEHHTVSAQPRPLSRSAHAHTLSSAPSSYGSDMQSSWTFLNAIPESLASTTTSVEEPDRRIETVVNNEDVILRAIALLELESTRVIHQQLQNILEHATSPGPKAPKEKSMQRINQRIVSISDPTVVARAQSLQAAAKHVVRRIVYALRIPRVAIGLGFGAGHWLDEARIAYRMCGRKQQDFFFFTLLTAFLGHHTQWLQRLAPDWYQKQHRLFTKQNGETHTISQRTIIVSDQRAIARRLIFLLASFLPGIQGLDGLQKPGEEIPGSHFSMSSPSSNVVRAESLRRAANRRMREHRLHPGTTEKQLLSTSAESAESISTVERPRRFLYRKDSDALSLKGPSLLSISDGENNRKVSASTTSALTSHPTTPVAVFATQRSADADGYFPPFVDHPESVATTDLAKILRRSSSSFGNSSNMSSRWGSLVSGLSDLWGNKQVRPGDSGGTTAFSSATGSAGRSSTEFKFKQNKSNSLQDMVDQLEGEPNSSSKPPKPRFVDPYLGSSSGFSSPTRRVAGAPRLRVDDKDGVIDVDLDLPGFAGYARFDPDELLKSPTKSSHRSSINSGRDVAESIRSLRIMPADASLAQSTIDTNVAGYLKKHHEDFSLHAVRPYSELENDVKKSMLAESISLAPHDDVVSHLGDNWTSVCTTVIADMRTFSVRKLTLKRRTDRAQSSSGPPIAHGSNTQKAAKVNNGQQMFVDEEIKDFDSALANAIDKVLDLGDTVQTPPILSPRISHSRTASSGTVKFTPPSMPVLGASSYPSASQEYTKQDYRHVVLGALEDVVKDVCHDLSKLEKGRDIRGSRNFNATEIKEEMRQENVLREGVKCWLLNLEQARVY